MTALPTDAAPAAGANPQTLTQRMPATRDPRPNRPLRLKRSRPKRPSLRFSPTAWAKLLFLRDRGDTEVGGFGIAPRADVLRVDDIVTVCQQTTPVTVKFDDAAVADFFDQQIDACRHPEQFGRIWIHTHPGDSAQPSSVDEATFDRVFGASDWAVMFILAKGGQVYARLRYNLGPGGSLRLSVRVDFTHPFPAAAPGDWEQEYQRHVHPERWDHFRPGDDPFLQFLEAPLATCDERLSDPDPFEEISSWIM